MHFTNKHKRLRRIILAFLALFVLGGGFCLFHFLAWPKKHAILIILDAARPDRFSCYGYNRSTTPNIDNLAKQRVVFENCFAQATATRSSIPRIIFSRYISLPLFPHSTEVPLTMSSELFRKMDNGSISLPKAFEKGGLMTAAILAHPWIISESPFAAEFQEVIPSKHFRDEPHSSEQYADAGQIIDAAINWINDHKNENFFLYLHLMDTHFPHYF